VDCVADGAAGACRTDSHSSVSLGYISTGLQITESDTVVMKYTGELQGRVACYCLTLIKVKVKVKFALEQATKAQRGSRGIAVLFP
jgi:hypothetical protein